MLAFLVLLCFELWMMHRHEPDSPHYVDHFSRVPGIVADDVQDPRNLVALPKAPLVPDSFREPATKPDDLSVGTQTLSPRGRPPEPDIGDIVVFEPPPRQQLPELKVDLSSSSSDVKGDYDGMRVAVLVPYSGPGLPLWFDAFTDLAAASKDAVDWIIFCEEVCIHTSQIRGCKKCLGVFAEMWRLCGRTCDG